MLFALDVSTSVKTYAVERFSHMKRQRGERFIAPHGWEPELIADAFGIIAGAPEQVVVAFSGGYLDTFESEPGTPHKHFAP